MHAVFVLRYDNYFKPSYWGEPEQAPYKCGVHEFLLSVCLSARTFISDNLQMYCSSNLRNTFDC